MQIAEINLGFPKQKRGLLQGYWVGSLQNSFKGPPTGRERRQAILWARSDQNVAAALTATGHWTAGLSAPLATPDATTLVMKLNLKDFCFSLSLNQTCAPGGVIW